MLDKIGLEKILFLDIETVPQQASFELLPDAEKELWTKKTDNLKKTDTETPASIYNRAGIYAEFGKIICISCGYFNKTFTPREFRLKSFYGDDEKDLLTEFCQLLSKHFNLPTHLLCAHNGKEFDFPYLSRRMLINGIALPLLLNTHAKKPWEVQHLDTMDLWRFGDYKSYTQLNLLAHVFGIPSPKDDIDGSKVWSVYWQQKDLNRIVAYCRKDVVTVAQIILKMRGEKLLTQDEILVTD